MNANTNRVPSTPLLRACALAVACVGGAIASRDAAAQNGTTIETPVVVGGSGFVVQTPGTFSWTFTATGPQLAVQCTAFGVPVGNTISFIRSGGGAFSTLARVSGPNPSFIYGQITAGTLGSVWIVNPNGISVNAAAISTVGSINFAAGTILDSDFLAGTRRFVGRTAIAHSGRITAVGPVALVGANVSNSGPMTLSGAQSVSIVAGRGTIELPIVPSDPQAFYSLAFDPSIPLAQTSTGVRNSGSITVAAGGAIRLGAGDGYTAAIQNLGTLQATNGEIRLTAPGERVEQSGDALRTGTLGVEALVFATSGQLFADTQVIRSNVELTANTRLTGQTAAAASVRIEGAVTSATATARNLELNAASAVVTGNLGTAANPLAAVTAASGLELGAGARVASLTVGGGIAFRGASNSVHSPGGVAFAGDLVKTDAGSFSVTSGGLVFTGAGVQRIEATGADLGPSAGAFAGAAPGASLLDALDIPAARSIEITDASDNAAGSEAIYARRLSIPTGSSLVVGASRIYTLDATIDGEIDALQQLTVGNIVPLEVNDSNCTGGNGSIVVGTVGAATVSWSGPGGFSSDSPSISGLLPGQYIASISGSAGSAVLRVRVGSGPDTTAPVIASVPTSTPVAAGLGCLAPMPNLTSLVVATDACGTPVVTQSIAPGTLLGLGLHPVVFTATDSSGNTSTASASIEVTGTQIAYYRDSDGDTFGNLADSVTDCVPPPGRVPNSGDCDDGNANRFPGNPEVCDPLNTDEDCDQLADNDDNSADDAGKTNYFVDADNDDYGVNPAVRFCDEPEGHAPVADDCDNHCPTCYPGAPETCANDGTDNDCDGEANSDTEAIDAPLWYLDGDSDGFGAQPPLGVPSCTPLPGRADNFSDCNDGNAAINPKAAEVCNDADDNCDGGIDEGLPFFDNFMDHDGDGFGDEGDSTPTSSCRAVPGEAPNNDDCNDGNAAINPNALETCDASNTDEDCDQLADDLDPQGALGKVAFYTDADDDNFGVLPSVGSFCDDGANRAPTVGDCNDAQILFRDADGDLYGSDTMVDCLGATNNADCDDDNNNRYPGNPEVCDSQNTDEDCDLLADDADLGGAQGKIDFYIDADHDGFGDAKDAARNACDPLEGEVSNNGDCNDERKDVNPSATERCDGQCPEQGGTDENCNGSADDADPTVDQTSFNDFFADADGDGYGTGTAQRQCDKPAGFACFAGDCDETSTSINPGVVEICDAKNVDEDCNDLADDADPLTDPASKIDFYTDADNDSHGALPLVGRFCDDAPGRDPSSDDCDDANPGRYPGNPEVCDSQNTDEDCDLLADDADPDGAEGRIDYYTDADNDSHGALPLVGQFCDDAPGRDPSSDDCDDEDSAINPDAIELCDSANTDEDCDELADDADPDGAEGKIDYYTDADNDSHGALPLIGPFCDDAPGRDPSSDDCDDANPGRYPGNPEVCDPLDVDEDCDLLADDADPDGAEGKIDFYTDADNDSHGALPLVGPFCDDAPGRDPSSDDCDDANPGRYPGNPEVCDSQNTDEDCDLFADDADPDGAEGKIDFYTDADNDSHGTLPLVGRFCDDAPGRDPSSDDCDDERKDVNPSATERCDGLCPDQGGADENCNGSADDADPTVDPTTFNDFFLDTDDDGYGAGAAQRQCDKPVGFACFAGDCDPDSDSINPGQVEICDPDNVDEDCNSLADDEDPFASDKTKRSFYADTDNDGFGYGDPIRRCDSTLPENSDDCYPDAQTWGDADLDGFGNDTLVACGVTNSEDCDDAQKTWGDADTDGFGNDTLVACGGVDNTEDCDDNQQTWGDADTDGFGNDILVACGGVDNTEDCDDTKKTWGDADTDGFGNDTLVACGGVDNTEDCDDTKKTWGDADTDGFGNDTLVACGGVDNTEDCNDNQQTWGDADADGFGNDTLVACGGVTNSDDCDDSQKTWTDADSDTFGSDTLVACDGVPNSDDCDDAVVTFNDGDGDGFGAPPAVACGNSTNNADCNDSDGSINPNAIERCDPANIDEDCDAGADDADPQGNAVGKIDFYIDADHDGFGNDADAPRNACDALKGEVANNRDCDDANGAINPNAIEVCDSDDTDEDCDGGADDADPQGDALGKSTFYTDGDGDGFGVNPAVLACDSDLPTTNTDCDDNAILYLDLDGDLWGTSKVVACGAEQSGDCDDDDAGRNPGLPEVCDAANTDEDCDTLADNADPSAVDADKTDFFVDGDSDTYGAGAASRFCDMPPGYSAVSTDCDDVRSDVNPGATEVCDLANTDEDCDTLADNADSSAADAGKTDFFVDGDSDTYGVGAAVRFCDMPSGYSAVSTDCDDVRADVNPGATEVCDAANTDEDCDTLADNADSSAADAGKTNFFVDGDSDTYGAGSAVRFCDMPSGYSAVSTDCDDVRADVNPGATEVCDAANTDEDCDTLADNADSSAADAGKTDFFVDGDSDTYGAGAAARFCDMPSGYSAVSTDCDDVRADVNPGATEVCDAANTDEDCDTLADNADSSAADAGKTNFFVDGDSDTYGAGTAARFCDMPSGYSAVSTDCDDVRADVNPGATEVCDAANTDEDCDTLADNADSSAADAGKTDFFVDGDSDTYGAGTAARFCDMPSGYSAVSTDCDDVRADVNPGATEVCDAANTDEDCDTLADNADSSAADAGKTNFFVDGDSDTYGAGSAVRFCDMPSGYSAVSTDCDDVRADVNPGATEVCDAANTDEDCDTLADNADSSAAETGKSNFFVDGDSDTYGAGSAVRFCDMPSGYSAVSTDCDDDDAGRNPGLPEVCDAENTDEDCDTLADNADSSAADAGKTDFFVDGDSDTYGAGSAVRFCDMPPGYSTVSTDCNDANTAINPNALELCDSANTNEDCDAGADDADPQGNAAGKTVFYADTDHDGVGDCSNPGSYCDLPPDSSKTCGDGCPSDPAKTDAGYCGCGQPEDANGNSQPDCTEILLDIELPAGAPAQGVPFRVRVLADAGGAIVPMNGMQTAVRYDATRLELVAVPALVPDPVVPVTTGDPLPPLSIEINQTIDNAAGMLLYALSAPEGVAMTGDTPLFDMYFSVKPGADLCAPGVRLVWLPDTLDPLSGTWPPIFVSGAYPGQGFPATLEAPVLVDLDRTAPVLTGVPADLTLPADADTTLGAFVAEPSVTAEDDCTGRIDPILTITDPSGTVSNAWPAGGMFAVGTTTLRWTAVDDTGNDAEAVVTVTVLDHQVLAYTLRLDCPQAAEAQHAIRFRAGSATAVAVVTTPSWSAGSPQTVSGTIEVPVAAGYACVEAKDVQAVVGGTSLFSHAITDAVAPSIVGRRYSASFVLVEGDSNNDDAIDIQDFSLFVADRSGSIGPDRGPEARSNFNADGFVNNTDFAVISVNFFKRGESCTTGFAGSEPLARISVKELRRRGDGHLAVADLNGDGWVDTTDVALFLSQGGAQSGSAARPDRIGRPASSTRW